MKKFEFSLFISFTFLFPKKNVTFSILSLVYCFILKTRPLIQKK